MKPFGSPRRWPPDLGDELRQRFSDFHHRNFRGDRLGPHPDLKATLDELKVWLDDPRDYERISRRNEWQSIVEDFKAVAASRGDSLTACTPSIDSLGAQLHSALGRDQEKRQACLHLLLAAGTELGTMTATTAAFDDLVIALKSRQTDNAQVSARMQALETTFRCGDRALANVASHLAGIFDNSALDVALARYELGGEEPRKLPSIDEDAGLTVEERIELARQMITRSTPAGHHVVWIVYGNARFDPWQFDIGRVTFFDGPAMLGLFQLLGEDRTAEKPTNTANSRPEYDLPPELLHPEQGEYLRASRHWPDEEDYWVAARIDLGNERYSDPIRVARDQADTLVHLAAFHSGRTTWKPFHGHLHIVDDVLHSSSGPFEDPVRRDSWIALEHTDEALYDLRSDLEPHLPVDNPALHELINAAAVLNTAAVSDDSAGLLHSVRIIELIATRCEVGWQSLLTDYLASGWAQAEIQDNLYRSVAALGNNFELKSHLPELDNVHARVLKHDSSRPRGIIIDYAAAVESLPDLVQELPDHDQGARAVRTVHHQTETTMALAGWVEDLVNEYGRHAGRLLRCRNSLAHGGPLSDETVATAAQFAYSQARRATAVALWGAYTGEYIKNSLDDYQHRKQQWRHNISSAKSVVDAMFELS